MDIPSFFDAYELRARYFPAVLLAAPLLTTVQLSFPGAQESIGQLIETAGLALALIYVMSLYVRHAGRRIQPRLWSAWNGAPSTRFARWRDPTLSLSQKKLLHDSVGANFGMKLPTSDEEATDKGSADSLISEAFDRARSYLRTNDASGLVAKQNAEYGALRNLLAVRRVFTIESSACMIMSLVLWFVFHSSGYLWAATAACAYFLIGIVVGWRMLPGMVRVAADTYAKNAWLTLIEIVNRKPPRQTC
jgi:hypothetical protein